MTQSSLSLKELLNAPPTQPQTSDFINLSQGLTAIGRAIALWRMRAKTRRDLRNLPEALRRDVGLTREDTRVEAMKPFWRA